MSDKEDEVVEGKKEEDEEDLPASHVRDPNDNDVLCGRGGAALRHPGNQTYRRLVNLNKGLYITCLKTEKLKISRSIVAAIREQNGRFLEKDAAKGLWIDIGDKKAIEKTSQALREGQPKLRQKIVEMGGCATGTAALIEQQFGANGIYQHGEHGHGGGMPGMAPGAHAGMGHGGYDPNLARIASGQAGQSGIPVMPSQHAAIAAQAAAMGSSRNLNTNGSNMDMPPPPQRQSASLQPEMFAAMSISSHNMNNGINNENDMDLSLHRAMQLRPSLVATKRGSGFSDGVGIPPNSMRSLMSDISAFGNSAHGTIGDSSHHYTNSKPQQSQSQDNENNNQELNNHFSQTTTAAGTTITTMPTSNGFASGTNGGNMFDRRRVFANSKYSRRPSQQFSQRSLNDGMPDIHMVESNASLFSGLSGLGPNSSHGIGNSIHRSLHDSTHDSKGGIIVPSAAAIASGSASASRASGSSVPDELGLGSSSRHSIMSGLSRISDTSEVHSIFSDLSRKIGNVSTRSIAMSEISGIDEQDREDDDSHTFGTFSSEPRTTSAGGMDFDW